MLYLSTMLFNIVIENLVKSIMKRSSKMATKAVWLLRGVLTSVMVLCSMVPGSNHGGSPGFSNHFSLNKAFL